MKSEKINYVLILVAVLWAIHVIDWILPLELNSLGIVPRTLRGLVGIVASPFLHADPYHLIGNTIPLLVLGIILVSFYDEIALPVLGVIVGVGGGLVWLLGRNAHNTVHIGASGVIYGIAAFLVAYGVMTKNLRSILIAGAVALLYGSSMLTGLLPFHRYVSWEGHLFSAAAGVLAAYIFSQRPANREQKTDV
ncbi:MAG: rhomboid family intramembrane serine protease [bacterium]|nr:rhomboid family intramembrane serine protease [bacterium]